MMDVRKVADKYGIMLVLDASLIGENAYLVKMRRKNGKKIRWIIKMITSLADLVYFLRASCLHHGRRHLHQPESPVPENGSPDSSSEGF